MPDDLGPPSLTTSLLRLRSGRLALSVESNKPYLDRSKWFQRVAYAWSSDAGHTWTEPRTVCADPTGRIANWDQRTGVTPEGDLVAFTWTYDFEAVAYRDITRRISHDEGHTWSEPEDMGFADQASHPAVMPDGRVVLAWVCHERSPSVRLPDRTSAV
jgi:Neuraminidase (sialidase)